MFTQLKLLPLDLYVYTAKWTDWEDRRRLADRRTGVKQASATSECAVKSGLWGRGGGNGGSRRVKEEQEQQRHQQQQQQHLRALPYFLFDNLCLRCAPQHVCLTICVCDVLHNMSVWQSVSATCSTTCLFDNLCLRRAPQHVGWLPGTWMP